MNMPLGVSRSTEKKVSVKPSGRVFLPSPCRFEMLSLQQQIKEAVSQFRKLMASHIKKRSSSGYEVLKFIKTWHPHLFVNRTHSSVGEFGKVPGVEDGDCFNSTAELKLVGLHRLPRSGIDWKEVRTSLGDKQSRAISVMVTDGYEDNFDQGEVLIYTGHGGKDSGAKQQTCDQKLVGGNLALHNSKLYQKSVRVIRSRYDPTMPSQKVYSYDGLYKVVDCVLDCKGKSGFKVYTFKLVRESGQAPLIWLGHHTSGKGRRLPLI